MSEPCHEIAQLLATAALFPPGEERDEAPLGPEDAALLAAHLVGCAGCRAAHEALQRAGTNIGEASQERARMEPLNPELRDRTLAAVQEVLDAEGPPAAARKKPPVGAAEPAVDPARVEAVGRQISLACSYCHDRARREDVVFCASCLAPHHEECFASHGRCSLPGCEETRTVRPADAGGAGGPPRRRGRLWTLLLTPLVAGGVAALTSLARREEGGQEGEQVSAGEDADQVLELPEVEVTRPKARPAAWSARCDVDVSDRPLGEVLAAIGSATRVNVLLGPAVDQRVSATLRQLPAREAIDVLARMTHCEVEELPDGVLLVDQPPLITFGFTDANVRTVLSLLGAYSGKNLVLAPDVTGRVTLDVKEMPWARVLDTIAELRGCHVTYVGPDLAIVTTRPLPAALVRRLRPLAQDPGPAVDLAVSDVPVGEVCELLARRSGRNVLADPALEARVTLQLYDVPLGSALEALARQVGARVEDRSGVLLLAPAARGRVRATDCPTQAWFALLAAASGTGLVTDENVGGVVTFDLKGIDWKLAAIATGAVQGLKVEDRREALTVAALPGVPHPVGSVDRTPSQPALPEQLAGLMREQELLARTAREAKSEEERARVLAALAAKQAELRALIDPPLPQTALSVPDPAEVRAAFDRLQPLLSDDKERVFELIASGELVQPMRVVVEALDVSRQLPLSDPLRTLCSAGLAPHEARGETLLGLRLQVRVTQVNEQLQAMSASIASERWETLRAHHARLSEVIAWMRQDGVDTQRDVFGRNAAAAQERGDALLAQGRELEQLGARASQVRVQALLQGQDRPDLCVVSGRVYQVGDELADDDGERGEPPLVVQEVGAQGVTFRLGQRSFVRELGQ